MFHSRIANDHDGQTSQDAFEVEGEFHVPELFLQKLLLTVLHHSTTRAVTLRRPVYHHGGHRHQ